MPNAGEFDAVLQYLKNKLPQLGFFSTLDEAVRAAPFEKAPAQQWQNYLKPGLMVNRNGVQFPLKAEELRYSGLPGLLHTFGPEGDQVNRDNIASMLHTPIDPQDLRLSKDALLEHLHRNRAGFNLDVRTQGSNTPGALRKRLPELDLLDQPQGSLGARQPPNFHSASYPDWAHVPGVPDSYEENITTSQDFGQFPSHFSPRDLSWSRTTRHPIGDQTARLVEEIQSDRHQAAAEKIARNKNTGYEAEVPPADSPFDNSNLEIGRRGYRTPEDERVLENRNTVYPAAAAQAMKKPPDTPFKDPADYGLLELKKQLLNSIHQGDSHLAIVDPQSQIDRYGTEEGRDAGMQHVYGNVYPSALRKLARMYGANVSDLAIPIRVPQQARRANTLAELGLDTPGEMINRIDDSGWENSGSIHDLIHEMLPEARRQGTDSELMKHLNIAQDALGDLDTYNSIANEYGEHGDEPYINEDGDEVSAMHPNTFMSHLERNRTMGRLDDSLSRAHTLYTESLDASPDNLQTKTFPALEITPEIAEKVKSTGIPLFKRGGEAEHFDDGGSVDDSSQQQSLSPPPEIPGIPEGEMMIWQEMPPAMMEQMRLEMLKNLYQQPMAMPAYGVGGAVEDIDELIDKYLQEIADQHAANASEAAARHPSAPRPPLHQPTEDPLYKAATATPAPIKNPLLPGFLAKRQAFAGGGDTHSALNWLRKAIENTKNLGYFGTHIPLPGLDLIKMSPKAEARIAVRAAQQLYGTDANGNPVFLGGIAHSGATPPGIVDEALSIPDSMAGLEELLMKITPGPNGNQHDLIHALDPQWSRNASARLGRLNQAVAKDTGIGAPTGLAEDAEDLAGQIGPLMAASRLAEEGTMARKALDQFAGWAGAGTQSTTQTPSWVSEDVGDEPVIDMAEKGANSGHGSAYNYAGGGEIDLGRRALLKVLGTLGVGVAAARPALEELASKVSKAPVKGAEMTNAIPDKTELADRFQWLKDEFFGPSDEPNWELSQKLASMIPGSEKLQQLIPAYRDWTGSLTHENAFTPENEAENLRRVTEIENEMDTLADKHGVPRATNPNE